MSWSRREFLEVAALSASGAVVSNALPVGLGQQVKGASRGERVAGAEFAGVLDARIVASLNQDWHFYWSESAVAGQTSQGSNRQQLATGDHAPAGVVWQRVNLPHTVRLEPRDVSGGLNYQGVCWYRRELRVQPEWKDRVIYLKFQGAMQVADVWLNGVHQMTHYGGYIPFTVDITRGLRFDRPNDLIVKLDNSDNHEVPPGKPQDQLDFCYFGGLYRSVDLEVLSTLHITDPILADRVAGGGIFVSFPAVEADSSTVQVRTELMNESDESRTCEVVQVLIDAEGKPTATATVTVTVAARSSDVATHSLKVDHPRLWHPNDPHLYTLHSMIREKGKVVDDEYTRIGIRSIRFDKDRGLLINGEPFFSSGANRHQDHPYVGYALPPSAHYRDAYKLREAGFTSYRSHYPQDPSFMDACDELGILAIVSNPGWQFVGDEIFKKRVYQDAREMIRRDRNHASVMLWEAELNESDNGTMAAELYRIVHEEYPALECYTAGNPVQGSVPSFNGWDITYISWDRWLKGSPHLETSGTFGSGPAWIREWGDLVDNWRDQQSPVRCSRGWGEVPMLVQAASHLRSFNRICQPGFQPAGANLWSGIDAARGYHHQPYLGCPLDAFRLPKFDYFMFQSQRPAQAQPARAGSGPTIFIANYATFQSPSEVVVYSNCEQVRLIQNGKELATQQPDADYDIPHPPFTFKAGNFSSTRSMLFGNTATPGAPGGPIGELRAEGLIGGKVVAEHVVHSPGVPQRLQLYLDACGLEPVADGGDWVRVYAHVCDARGITYPYADDMVTFSVSGEAALIGDGSIFANPLRAEAGIATALVRMTKTAGSIMVTATSPGLRESTLAFRSVSSKLRVI